MEDIIRASRQRSQSASLIPDRQRSKERPRVPSGGTIERKPPPGINYIDRMCEAQDRVDRAAATRVRVETALVEAIMNDKISNKIKSDYNPFSRERMGFSDDDE